MSKISKEGFEQIQVIKNALDSMFDKLEAKKVFNEVKDEFEQMTSQMELKMIDQLKSEILKKTIVFTETRIKRNLGNKHNKKLIDESLQKLTNHFS